MERLRLRRGLPELVALVTQSRDRDAVLATRLVVANPTEFRMDFLFGLLATLRFVDFLDLAVRITHYDLETLVNVEFLHRCPFNVDRVSGLVRPGTLAGYTAPGIVLNYLLAHNPAPI